MMKPDGSQRDPRSACHRHRPHIADRYHSGVKKRHARQCVGVVADMAGIGSLDHDNACVVIYRDNPNRDPGKQLAHDAGVSDALIVTSSGLRPAASTARAKRLE